MVAGAYFLHNDAWASFFGTMGEMQAAMVASVGSPPEEDGGSFGSFAFASEEEALREFGAVRNFWILFAAAHANLTVRHAGDPTDQLCRVCRNYISYGGRGGQKYKPVADKPGAEVPLMCQPMAKLGGVARVRRRNS